MRKKETQKISRFKKCKSYITLTQPMSRKIEAKSNKHFSAENISFFNIQHNSSDRGGGEIENSHLQIV